MVNIYEGKSKRLPPQIDGVSEHVDINNIFSNKYRALYNSVPSDPSVLFDINNFIEGSLQTYNGNEHIITVQEMKEAKDKLKYNKYDGSDGLWSNNILYAPESLNVHMSMLATSMLVHGHNAEQLVVGTIISLHKGRYMQLREL